VNAREHKAAQAHLTQVREANSNGKLKRTDFIAAVLQGTREMTIQEIIVALNKEFGWKCGESNLTGHLYTNPKLFTHQGRSVWQNSDQVVAQVAAKRSPYARPSTGCK
jgi:hypothetical protein